MGSFICYNKSQLQFYKAKPGRDCQLFVAILSVVARLIKQYGFQIIVSKLLYQMGGKHSEPTGQERNQVLRINHPKFQNVKFTRNKNDEDCIEVQLPVANVREYNQWVSDLKDAPTHSENFLLPEAHQFQKQGFCGSSGFVNVLFQNFPYVLADQIRNRSSLKRKYFDEPELWYLIYTLLSAGYQFHKTGRKVGDVRPENVFINQDGQVKVATRLTWPSENENYHKTFYEKQPTYLAPEQLKDIQFAKMEPSCDPKLAESFSVGLTCLDAGTLSSSSHFYNKNNKFDYASLSNKLQELQINAGYSQILCLTIGNLCEPDPDRRSSCTELYKWLEPHQESIVNLERFEVSNLPQKIANFGHAEQIQESQSQSSGGYQNQGGSPPFTNVAPQQVTYIRQSVDQSYLNGSQQPPPAPLAYQGGQTVTYISQPVPGQPQPVPGQPQPAQQFVQQKGQIVYQQIQNPSGQEVQKNTGPIYAYSQYTPMSQYVPSGPAQYGPQAGTSKGGSDGERQKSAMELTLQKIDEQLQMSRKMFPS